jgi:phage terminase large subunit-like protein
VALIAPDQLFVQARERANQELISHGIAIDRANNNQMREYAELIAFYEQDLQYNKIKYYQPFDYQKKLYQLRTMAQAVIASNRSGKSYSVGYAIACHLTGIYPEWWGDIQYQTGVRVIAAGASSQQIREAIQDTLLGTQDKIQEEAIGSGLVPRSVILRDTIITGADRRGIGGLQIRHKSGSISTIQIVSYEQDRAVLQGGKADVIWFDEQPRDDDVVSELIRALAQTPTGQEGRIYLSATPLVGWTPMIKRFWEGVEGHSMVRYTWDDVPESLLDSKTRDLLRASWLPWEIESRTQGIPMAGAGSVFQIDWDRVILKEPPKLEVWHRKIAGIDFGRSPDPTAVIWIAYDPRTQCTYVYDEYYGRSQTPVEYAPHILSRGKDIPVAWPPDGQRKGYTETTSAIHELTNRYGIRTLNEPFTNPDGSRGIDYGLQYMIQQMRMGRFFVSPHCRQLIDEMRQYHTERTSAGRINFRGSDHGIDALRYGALSIERFGQSSMEAEGIMSLQEYQQIERELNTWHVNTY